MSPGEVAAAYAIGASPVAVALVIALRFLEPEFAPSWRMLSEYSLGRYSVLIGWLSSPRAPRSSRSPMPCRRSLGRSSCGCSP